MPIELQDVAAAPGGAVPPVRREAERRQRLATMRRWATAMLVAVSVAWVVLVAVGPSGSWAGYARAALEASMVGALADWFAVVALFRHPLGIPIPHTAVVVERKDQFARTLAEFFRENFLSGQAVAERLRTSRAVSRAGTWAAEPANATSLARHVLRHARGVLDAAGDDVARVVVDEALTLAAEVPVTDAGANALRGLSESPLVDDVVDRLVVVAGHALDANRDELELRFSRDRPWWLPEAVQRRVFDHVVERVEATLADVRTDPAHPLRATARRQLADLARRMQHDPALADRVERWKHAVLRDPRVAGAMASSVRLAVARFHEQAGTPGSPLETRVANAIEQLGSRVRDDADLHVRVEDAVEVAVSRGVEIFGDDIDALVTGTIARWDADRTADQLELLLGPDLQFIRINGTVVGALAGLAIHAVGQILG